MSRKRYAMVLDMKRCVNCKGCTVACKMENNVPVGDEAYRNWVTELPLQGSFPNLHQEFRPSQCQHCENAPCKTVCPTWATYRAPEGVVRIDDSKCILCSACMLACPYNARYKSVELKTIDKCNFCWHRLEEGREPACVETCAWRVREFGDLNDPHSEVSRLLALREHYVLKPEVNTRPRLYYLV